MHGFPVWKCERMDRDRNMKHTIYGISLAVIAMLVVAALLGVSGNSVRNNEIETALNTAIEQSLEQLKGRKGYETGNYQELVADFNQLLLLQVESDSAIQVEILAADAEKGVLDVRVTETYQNILGQERKMACRKSVILEEYTEKKGYHTVTLLADGKVYDQYSLYEGGKAVNPKDPEKSGKSFRYWVKQGEYQKCDVEHLQVEGDLTLEAVFY